jgi:hypothetical protein
MAAKLEEVAVSKAKEIEMWQTKELALDRIWKQGISCRMFSKDRGGNGGEASEQIPEQGIHLRTREESRIKRFETFPNAGENAEENAGEDEGDLPRQRWKELPCWNGAAAIEFPCSQNPW